MIIHGNGTVSSPTFDIGDGTANFLHMYDAGSSITGGIQFGNGTVRIDNGTLTGSITAETLYTGTNNWYVAGGAINGVITANGATNNFRLLGGTYTNTINADGDDGNSLWIDGGNYNGIINTTGANDFIAIRNGSFTKEINTIGGNNTYSIGGGTFTAGSSLNGYEGNQYFNIANHLTETTPGVWAVDGRPDFQAGSEINIIDNIYGTNPNGRVSIGNMDDTFGATVTMDATNNILQISGLTSFRDDNGTYTASADLSGTGSNTVQINASPSPWLTGQITLEDAQAGSVNTVELTGGKLLRTGSAAPDSASIIGSSYADTVFRIGGGETAYIQSSGAVYDRVDPAPTAGTGIYHFTGGQVFNITHGGATAKTEIGNAAGESGLPHLTLPDYAQVTTGTADRAVYSGNPASANPRDVDGRTVYNANAILNMNHIDLVNGAAVVIGDIDRGEYNTSVSGNQGNDYATLDLGDNSAANGHNVNSNYAGRGDFFITGNQAQITANTVNIWEGSKLTIHENTANAGFDPADVAHNPDGTVDWAATTTPGGYDWANRNIVDHLNVMGLSDSAPCYTCDYDLVDVPVAADEPDKQGIVTIDRTTLHTGISGGAADTGIDPDASGSLFRHHGYAYRYDHPEDIRANVFVGTGGVIQGFGEITSETDHTPRLPNVAGNVAVLAGGMIRPFDSKIFTVQNNALSDRADYNVDFERNARKLKGLVFKVDGTTHFEHSSRLSTRLFAEHDFQAADLTLDTGAVVPRRLGDSVESTAFVFDEIRHTSIQPNLAWQGVSQANKVQYQPVFGFQNEIKSKLEYDVGETYHYQVAYGTGTAAIEALRGMSNANHIFNRDILFSDMLGNWNFEKQDNDRGVVLRFRQLAKHPMEGGILADVRERNSRQTARRLDEIRYPFLTPTNMMDPGLMGLFGPDPSLKGGYQTPFDNGNDGVSDPFLPYGGNPYDQAGFDGNIQRYYKDNAERFGGYKGYYLLDISNFLRALQLEIQSSRDLERVMRLITAEPYAAQLNADISLMDRFREGRERNSVSASYLVETSDSGKFAADPLFVAPIDGDMPTAYVQNPMHIWASTFGGLQNQKKTGDEYGFDSENYGFQLGAVKELGDLYLGLTYAYNHGENEWEELQAENSSNAHMGELLVGYRRGMGFLEAYGGVGFLRHGMTRDITLGTPLNESAYDPGLDCNLDDNYQNGVYSVQHKGNYTSRVVSGGLRLGYSKVFLEKWLLQPTLGINVTDVRNPSAFREDGPYNSAFLLEFEKGGMKKTSWRVPALVRLSRPFAFNWSGPWMFTPEIRGGVSVRLDSIRNGTGEGGENDEADVLYKWAGNPIPNRFMKSWGAEPGRYEGTFGATMELSRRGRFYAAVNYDYVFNRQSESHNASLQLGLGF